MSEQPYVHQPASQAVRTHLTRYPRHYGALGLWLVAMLVVPTVGRVLPMLPIVGDHFESDPPPVSTIADEVAQAPQATPPFGGGGGPARPSPTAAPAPADPGPTTSEATPRPAPSNGSGPQEAPPDNSLTLPTLPPLPIPAPPPELHDLLAVVTPMTEQGCSAIGLAGVLLTLVGPGVAADLPVAQLLGYLTPVYTICGFFPTPESSGTVCAVDEAAHAAGYPADVSGLLKTPNIVGIAVDTLVNIDAAMLSYTGQSAGIADQLYEQLDCHRPEG